MKSCASCGLGVENSAGGNVKCFKYATVSNANGNKENCLYYIDTVFEDGEQIPPLQHLLLKEEELKARKMKGVI